MSGGGVRAVSSPDGATGAGRPPGGGHSGRIPGLDGIRAAAILIVMLSHAGLGAVIPGGFGVTLFFFLSGYLITTLLRIEWQRTGRIDLLAFYGRRAARILPPLYLTMGLVIALIAAGQLDGTLGATQLAVDGLFVTNYAAAFGVYHTLPIPLWSLDVEEHYYLVFPLVFIAVVGWRRPATAIALFCLGVLAIRVASFAAGHQLQIYYWTHTRIDSIMFGALLALWRNPILDPGTKAPGTLPVIAALALIGATLAIRSPFFRETLRYTLQGVALFVLVSALIHARGFVARVADARPLRLVATLSYTLYLVHLPLLGLAVLASWPPWLAIAVAYALAFAWAGLMLRLVERPLARWRRRSLRRTITGRGHQV